MTAGDLPVAVGEALRGGVSPSPAILLTLSLEGRHWADQDAR